MLSREKAARSALSPPRPAGRPGARPGGSARRVSPRQQRLLDDIEALFLIEGFLRFRTEDIARRLRCSKTTLYRIAPTRDRLYEMIVERFLQRVRQRGIAATGSARDWSAALVGLLGAGVEGARDVSWEFVGDMREHPLTNRCLNMHQTQRASDVERLLEAGIKQGAFRDIHPKLVARSLLQLIDRIFDSHFLESVGLSLAEAYEEAYRMVEYGLIPRTKQARLGREFTEIWPSGPRARRPS